MNIATVTFRFNTPLDKDRLNQRLNSLLKKAVDGVQGGMAIGDHTTVVLEKMILEEIVPPTPNGRQLALTWWREESQTVRAIIAYSNLPEYESSWWTGSTIEEVWNKINKGIL
jgi:hypothetical protein